MMNRITQSVSKVFFLLSVLLIVACSDGGIEGTGMQAGETNSEGSITGFGSIFVNGIEYETDTARITVNGEELQAGEDRLALGMVVQVSGFINADGKTGRASSVSYGQDVYGPVAALVHVSTQQLQLSILGVTVHVDDDTVLENVSFDTLAEGHLLSVSGFRRGGNSLLANRLELQTPSPQQQYQIKMVISRLDRNALTFMLGDLTIDYSTLASEFDPQEGWIVDVKGTMFNERRHLIADNIQRVQTVRNTSELPGAIVKVEGVISEFESLGSFWVSGWKVSGEFATIHRATTTDLGDGVRVEISGLTAPSGYVVAEEITVKSLASSVYVGSVTAVDLESTMMVVDELSIIADGFTRFNDKTERRNRQLHLATLSIGDIVKVKGSVVDGVFVASSVERLSADDESQQSVEHEQLSVDDDDDWGGDAKSDDAQSLNGNNKTDKNKN